MEINLANYSKEGMRDRKLLAESELKMIKKKCYDIFLKSWDEKIGGKMTPSRFYSSTVHMKYKEDWDAARKFFLWCKKTNVPFAPTFKKKFMLKIEK